MDAGSASFHPRDKLSPNPPSNDRTKLPYQNKK